MEKNTYMKYIYIYIKKKTTVLPTVLWKKKDAYSLEEKL